MNCQRTQTHTVKPGDSLYQIAKMHQMTVSEVYALNPDINPYNLQIGSSIIVCQESDRNHHPQGLEEYSNCNQLMSLSNRMRLAWEQHVYWTRMLLISIASGLGDQKAVTDRLMQNPSDIANIFADYYSEETANAIANLLTQHLQIGAELITALRDNNMEKANQLNNQWYANANQMAIAFNTFNPYYSLDMLRDMLYRHLQMTTQEIMERLAMNYAADIAAFDQVELEALMMADYFTNGIVQQFPENFR